MAPCNRQSGHQLAKLSVKAIFFCLVWSRHDVERMRQPAGVLSSEEVARLRHEAEAELEGQRAVSKARKDKMLKVKSHLTSSDALRVCAVYVAGSCCTPPDVIYIYKCRFGLEV